MLIYLQFAPIITAFFVAGLLLVLMTPFAHQLGLVDYPSPRKPNAAHVPLTGGVAIYFAVFIASLVTDVWFQNDSLFFTASFFIILLGMLDDRFDLSPKGRLICQFGVAAIMAWAAQNYVTSLGDIFSTGPLNLGAFGYFFTLICVVGVINAFNMIDGIDGLAGGISLIVLLAMVVLLLMSSNGQAIMAPLIVISALIPFLAFNLSVKGFKGNKIYMGDSGSMFIGLTIVWLIVEFTQGDYTAMRPITAVWIIGLPLMDMASTMFRRARKGKSVLRPDRHHLHFIFMRAGLSARRSLVAVLLMASLYACVGIIGEVYNVPESIMLLAFIVGLVVYCVILQHIWKILRVIRNKRSLN